MNNLTTRKIVLGMLMILVLAFSVQGTADAITSFTRGSGDLQLYAPGEDFTISFTPRLQSRIDDGRGNDPITYYYDDERINIEVIGANIRKVGSFDITPIGSHAMNEQGTNATRLSGGVTLTLRADDVPSDGTVQITITDTTVDQPADSPVVPELIFTVYIAPEHDDTSTLKRLGPPVDFSIGEEQITKNFSGVSNVRVNYTVSGSGSLILKTDDNQYSGGRNLTTSSAAPVFLNMGGSTNKVTASVVGQRAERAQSVTYIYSYAVLSKVSGDEQRGSAGAMLENPLVVRVVDGKNRNVSGVPIDFSAAGDGSFLPDSNFPSDLNIDNDSVRTNSAGVANISWVLGPGTAQSVTAMLSKATDIQANTVTFTATFGTTTSTPSSIVIKSGNGQRANEFGLLEDPLVVIVRDQRGQRMNNAVVTFFARDGGTLYLPSGDDPGERSAGGTNTDTIKDIDTNTSGEASVRYTPPEGGERRTVSASISSGLKSETFIINGSPGTGTGSGTGTGAGSSVSPTSIIGAPGSTHTLTINAGAPNTDITIGNVAFSVAGGSASPPTVNTGSSTSVQSLITLPDTVDTYTLNVRIGAVVQSVSIAVTTATQETETGTLSLEVPASGTSGDQLTVEVTATMPDGDPGAGVDVALSTSGGIGTLSSSTVRTNASGLGRATLTLGTAGSTGFVTASATGYNERQLRVTVSGGSTTGTRLLVSDGVDQTGEPGT